MPNLTPSPSPVTTLLLRALEETDYAIPATWHDIHQVLLDNDAVFAAAITALQAGAGIGDNTVTDAKIGSRTVNDALVPSVDTNTLTTLLGNVGNRLKAITGAASWRTNPDTTLAAAATHASSTAPHSATSAATPDRLMIRDANGRVSAVSPTLDTHVATKGYVDTLAGIPGEHNHDDRYYTKSELGASGNVGTNVVHADRVGAGTLDIARIPIVSVVKGGTGLITYTTGNYLRAASASVLEQRTPAQVLADIGAVASSHTHDATAITTGTFDIARLPTITAAKGGTGLISYTTGNYINAASASALQQRTPAQVLADIGAATSGHGHALTDAGITGTLPATKGGTGLASFTTGNYINAASASTLQQRTPANVLSDIGAAAASHVHSAADVTSGILAVARGGTGLGTYTATHYLYASGTGTLATRSPAAVLTDIGAAAAAHVHSAADVTSGTLAVARGGTGIASYTTGNYINASGATTLQQRTPTQVRSDIGAAASTHVHAGADITSGFVAMDRGGTGLSWPIGTFLYRPLVGDVLPLNIPSTMSTVGLHTYVSFQGSAVTPTRLVYKNVLSLSDNGLGDYTINFNTSISRDPDTIMLGTVRNTSGTALAGVMTHRTVTPTNIAWRIQTRAGLDLFDPDRVMVAFIEAISNYDM
jgi:hypothetical protein